MKLVETLALAVALTSAAPGTQTLSPNGETLAFPTSPSFSGTITLPPSDAPPGTLVRLSASPLPPARLPRPIRAILRERAGATMVWLVGDISNDVSFGFGTVAYRFDVPGVALSRDDFYAVACDRRNCRRPYVFGPMRRDRNALAFSTQHFPFHFFFSARANHDYIVAIYRARTKGIR